MFSWAAWPSSQGMPTRPFALGVAPTDLARPGDGAAGPAAPLSQEQKSERGEDATPPRGTAELSLRPACASLGLGRPAPRAPPFAAPPWGRCPFLPERRARGDKAPLSLRITGSVAENT